MVPKPDGSSRLILNLKKLNKFIATEHFKLEDRKTVINLMSPNCFMATIDLKDAYVLRSTAVPLAESDKKFLRFRFNDQLYEFTYLSFGLTTTSYVFTKILKPVIAELRSQGYLSIIYLDDLLLFGKTYEKCKVNIQTTSTFLQQLGFIINKKKCQLVPSKRCKFLGSIQQR